MNINPSTDIDRYFENIINTYENRIQKIQTAFQSSEKITESTHTLYDSIHNSLNDLKNQRNQLNTKLCETLAKNGSLRKKDYNILMSGILNSLEEKEKETETRFLHFLEVQKQNAQLLKSSLLAIQNLASEHSTEKIGHLKEQLTEISQQQEKAKESVIESFTHFQNLHNQITTQLEKLLEKGNSIIIKDLKNVKEQITKVINPSAN